MENTFENIPYFIIGKYQIYKYVCGYNYYSEQIIHYKNKETNETKICQTQELLSLITDEGLDYQPLKDYLDDVFCSIHGLTKEQLAKLDEKLEIIEN